MGTWERLGASASWGLGTGYRALRFAAANCTPPGWPLSGVSRPVSGVIAQGFADVPLESRWAALARPACRLGRARREKFSELAAICLAVGGADQAAQHNTGLHRGPRRAGALRGARDRSNPRSTGRMAAVPGQLCWSALGGSV